MEPIQFQKKILSFKLVLRVSPSSIRSSTRLSRVQGGHSLLPTKCRAVASEPTQVPLAPKDTRGCSVPQSQWRWAWHSHGGAFGAPCSRTATPVGETVKAHRPRSNVQSATTPPHYRPFLFCFIHVVGPFAPSLTLKTTAQLHKREGTKRKGGTIPPSRRGSTLSSTHHHCSTGDRSHIAESAPQCAPHHRAVNNGRDAAMHRPAPFYHPSSVACPHKVANKIRVHTNPTIPLTR
ncbi:hypothetical protein ECC02_011335 [Trypanosoma cruzi]|uniref:Uncharacterized protein n=1 Tax=Trypanosoma cruzi TaxID=5693 RepID=A0A7J6XQ24_TRYCR|nr:hypothetical protein ECC02_011335 [Trypanosoma cruzi]